MVDFGGGVIPEELFAWIRSNIPDKKTILECGSGRGTVELMKHYTVYSIEHDPHWLNLGANYIFAPLKKYEGYTWYDVDVLKNLPEYDLLLIDGPTANTGRYGIVKNRDLFNWTVPIALDDTHRAEEQRMVKELSALYKKKIHEFKSKDKRFTILT